MIRIIDDQIKRFIDFLNQNYGTEAECIVSVFNCQDSVCVSEDGKEEQSLFIPEADLVMLTTEKPANGIFDSAGNPEVLLGQLHAYQISARIRSFFAEVRKTSKPRRFGGKRKGCGQLRPESG